MIRCSKSVIKKFLVILTLAVAFHVLKPEALFACGKKPVVSGSIEKQKPKVGERDTRSLAEVYRDTMVVDLRRLSGSINGCDRFIGNFNGGSNIRKKLKLDNKIGYLRGWAEHEIPEHRAAYTAAKSAILEDELINPLYKEELKKIEPTAP